MPTEERPKEFIKLPTGTVVCKYVLTIANCQIDTNYHVRAQLYRLTAAAAIEGAAIIGIIAWIILR